MPLCNYETRRKFFTLTRLAGRVCAHRSKLLPRMLHPPCNCMEIPSHRNVWFRDRWFICRRATTTTVTHAKYRNKPVSFLLRLHLSIFQDCAASGLWISARASCDTFGSILLLGEIAYKQYSTYKPQENGLEMVQDIVTKKIKFPCEFIAPVLYHGSWRCCLSDAFVNLAGEELCMLNLCFQHRSVRFFGGSSSMLL